MSAVAKSVVDEISPQSLWVDNDDRVESAQRTFQTPALHSVFLTSASESDMLLSLRCWRAAGLAALIVVGVAVVVPGCGGGKKSEPTVDTGEAEEGEEPAAPEPKSSSTKKAPGKKPGTSKTTAAKGPTVDGIPLDVFFDRPLQVAADKTSVGTPATATVASNDQKPMPMGDTGSKPMVEATKPAPGGGAVSWDKLISVEVLLDSVKACRNQWAQRLANVQTYNSAQLEMPVFGTEMVFLAELARTHPGEVRWKKDAKFIRALAMEVVKVASGAEGKGKKAFDTINGNFQKIGDILDGNTPPGLPEATDDTTLEACADIKYLMKRLERAESNLKNNAGSEENLKKNAASVAKDVVMYYSIAQAIKDKSYGYDAEADYNKAADAMREAAKGMEKAVADNNFTEFDNLRNTVTQKCSECHMTYRTGQ